MAPEALDGRPPSPSFDLWSLAVVLFESVAGQHPFRYGARDAADGAGQTQPVDIRELAPQCPTNVAAFFRECLAVRLRQRPSTARQMKSQLGQLAPVVHAS
jgi:serine/threonine protein kinase